MLNESIKAFYWSPVALDHRLAADTLKDIKDRTRSIVILAFP